MLGTTRILHNSIWKMNKTENGSGLDGAKLRKHHETKPYTRQPLSRAVGQGHWAVMSWAGAVMIWAGALKNIRILKVKV